MTVPPDVWDQLQRNIQSDDRDARWVRNILIWSACVSTLAILIVVGLAVAVAWTVIL